MESKSLWQSKTIWGGFLALLPALSDAADQLASIPFLAPELATKVAAIGGTLAIIGRLLAKVPVKLVK